MNNKQKYGYLVIRRFKPGETGTFPIRVVTSNFIEPSEVQLHYKGIEGEHWPDNTNIQYKNDLLELSYKKTFNIYRNTIKFNKKELYDLIFVKLDADEKIPIYPIKGFVFYGFDYGIYTSAWNVYSVIINEVLYGKYEELRKFSNYLNDNLLFPNMNILIDIIETRKKLLTHGADLENSNDIEDQPRIIGIYGYDGEL